MTAPDISTSPARAAAVEIIASLRRHGHVAYLAGGCVRDEQLGLTPKDYDVATDAPPPRVKEIFPKAQAVGEAFGVMLVRRHKVTVEVATFRSESGYSDHRRPDEVHFTDAQHDAQRRDFTINGLFGDPLPAGADGESLLPATKQLPGPGAGPGAPLRVLDYVGGLDDLKAGVIRAIGNADQRFAEDYLRMLRAVRFAGRFGFTIAPQTAAAIRAQARHLGLIARERIGQEVRLMLTGPRPAVAARWIHDLHLDGPTLHEDHLPLSAAATAHDLVLLTHVPPPPPPPELSPPPESPPPPQAVGEIHYITRLAAWMLDRHWPWLAGPALDLNALHAHSEAWAQQQAPAVLRRWRKALVLTNEETEALQHLWAVLPGALAWPTLQVAPRKRLLAASGWTAAATLLQALGHAPATRQAVAALLATLAQDVPALLHQGVAPAPWVTGDDLIALGRKPGPAFRRILDSVYDGQLDGRFPSRQAALDWLTQHAVGENE